MIHSLFIDILEELDTKQRKIRSVRGFFIYALEIMEAKKDLEILTTNLKASFWRKLKTILRQNKKEVLLRFLFGSQQQSDLEETIQNLQDQVNSLQNRIIELENQTNNLKYALRDQNKAPDTMKSIQQGDYTLDLKKSPYSLGNDGKVNHEVREAGYIDLDMLSEADIRPFTAL